VPAFVALSVVLALAAPASSSAPASPYAAAEPSPAPVSRLSEPAPDDPLHVRTLVLENGYERRGGAKVPFEGGADRRLCLDHRHGGGRLDRSHVQAFTMGAWVFRSRSSSIR